MIQERQCSAAGKFSIWEKLYAQASFLTIGVAGTIGIILVDWIWIIPYIIIYWYGIPGIIMRHLSCPRCPHFYVYGDCLQAPLILTRSMIKNQKANPFSTFEKILFHLIFIVIPVYPIYWLLSNKLLLAIFLISTVMWYSGQFLYFCKKCRVKQCPYNNV